MRANFSQQAGVGGCDAAKIVSLILEFTPRAFSGEVTEAAGTFPEPFGKRGSGDSLV